MTTVRGKVRRWKKLGPARQERNAQTIVALHGNAPLAKALPARLRRKYSLLGQKSPEKSKRPFAARKLHSDAKSTRAKHLLPDHHIRIQKDIKQIKQVLSIIVEQNEVDRWLSAPNAMLGGMSPLRSIKQGKTRQVAEVLARLEDGIYV